MSHTRLVIRADNIDFANIFRGGTVKRTARYPFLFLSVLCVLTACAPAAGRPAIVYSAATPDVISAVSQFGPQIQPGGAFNFLSIETIGDRFITLSAAQTTGFQVLGALAGSYADTTIRVTVTVAPVNQEVAQVAISALPAGNSIANSTADRLINELDMRFKRLGQPQTGP